MVAKNDNDNDKLGECWGEERLARIANEVCRRTKSRKDFVAPRGKLGVTVLEAEGQAPRLALSVQNGHERVLPLSRHALLQLEGSLDVPTRFADALESRGHLDLVAGCLGELLAREDKTAKGEPRRHLVRELDGEVDGFLSDRFKAISNDSILAIVLEEADKIGARVWDFKLTPTQFRINLISPTLIGKVQHAMRPDAPGSSHGWASLDQDEQNAACTVGNSENGHGRFFGDIAFWTRACSNYCILEKGVARVHLGGKLEEGEQVIVSDETRELEDAALVSKLRDVIKTAFDPARFRRLLDSLSATTARVIGEASAIETVDASIWAFGLPQARRDAILEAFLRPGPKSQYWLGQALTAQVNPAHAGDLGDAERVAFEQAGGKILAMGERDWRRFLAGAIKPQQEEQEAQGRHQTVAVVRT